MQKKSLFNDKYAKKLIAIACFILDTGIVSSVVLKIMASHAELKDKNLAKSLDEHSKYVHIHL